MSCYRYIVGNYDEDEAREMLYKMLIYQDYMMNVDNKLHQDAVDHSWDMFSKLDTSAQTRAVYPRDTDKKTIIDRMLQR